MNVDINADLDPAFPAYDPNPASKIQLDPCGSGSATLGNTTLQILWDTVVTLSRQEEQGVFKLQL